MFFCSVYLPFFFSFPQEPTIKEQWIDVTGREHWMPTKSSTICSKHFKEKDYLIKKSGHKYLKCGAVPQENVVRICSTNAVRITFQYKYSITL